MEVWRSQTLPRQRASEKESHPIVRGAGTLTRTNRKVDVQKLRQDIEMLSCQLNMVRAQLDSQLDQDMDQDLPLRNEETDSRLSTVLFSPSSTRSKETPTPQPTQLNITIGSQLSSTVSTLRRGTHSTSTPYLMTSPTSSTTNQRLSYCVPSTSIVVPRVKRRETFTKADVNSPLSTLRTQRVKRADSYHSLAPPKPQRTFVENLDQTLRRNLASQKNNRFVISSTVFDLPAHKSDEQVARTIQERFRNNECWFTLDGHWLFINPFNNIASSTNLLSHSISSSIASSLLQKQNSVLVMRGVSGSGKTQLCEMIVVQLAEKLKFRSSANAALCAAITVLRPMLTINNRNNNQSSRVLQHFELHLRDNVLTGVALRHFMLESPSRGCKANIFAMLANDMNDTDKERFRIAGFQLRENYANYGNLDDIRSGLTTLGFSVIDVFTVLSACTLLNNLVFKEMKGFVDIDNLRDLEDASHLLGISSLSLYRAIMNVAGVEKCTISACRRIRDDLVSCMYSRLVHTIISKANRMLEIDESSEDESLFNDSGIGMGSFERRVIHIVDAPGYTKSAHNCLPELLINTINDILEGQNHEKSSKLLQNVESAQTFSSDKVSKRPVISISHGNLFNVDYDTTRLCVRNINTLSRELVSLFDKRCCSSHFVSRLFGEDLDKLREDMTFEPLVLRWPTNKTTVIQNIFDCTSSLQSSISSFDQTVVNCIKSNDRMEYARFSETCVISQIQQLRSRAFLRGTEARSPVEKSYFTSSTLVPRIPAERTYEIRDGKKHIFPQRRTMIVDFFDQSSNVDLHAGEIVKAVSFSGECYMIETGRKQSATVPISFTEKSLPPTEGYCV